MEFAQYISRNNCLKNSILTVSFLLSSDVDFSHQPLHSFFTAAQPNPLATNKFDYSNMDTHLLPLEHPHHPILQIFYDKYTYSNRFVLLIFPNDITLHTSPNNLLPFGYGTTTKTSLFINSSFFFMYTSHLRA